MNRQQKMNRQQICRVWWQRLLGVMFAAGMVAVVWYYWQRHHVQWFEDEHFGQTRLVSSSRAGLAIILTGHDTVADAEATAQQLEREGLSTATISLDDYWQALQKDSASCFDLTTLLDLYAQDVQDRLAFDHFVRPVLIGVGSAAPVVRLTLAQSSAGIFAGGIGVGPAVPLRLPVTTCAPWPSGGSAPARTPLDLPADLATSAPWVSCSRWDDNSCRTARQPLLASSAQSSLSVVPLIELPQPDGGRAPYFAIVISGDGGWANIDKQIGEALGEQGVAVVGWNSLRYFWQARTPEEVGADLTTVLQRYRAAWRKPEVLLIGFSMGADVLPFMVSRLPDDLRRHVAGLVLMSPSDTADFQFHVSQWIGSDDNGQYPLLPEVQKLSGLRWLCIQGNHDDPGLCAQSGLPEGAEVVTLPGDHHYDGDYQRVVQEILQRYPTGSP